MKRRILSWVLALAMILSMVPGFAFAEGEGTAWTKTAFETIQPTDTVAITMTKDGVTYALPTTGAGGSVYGAPVISFAEGVTGEYEFLSTGYKKGSLTMKVTAPEGAEGVLATVSFAVPTTVDPEVDYLKYRVNNITFTDKDGKVLLQVFKRSIRSEPLVCVGCP
mgnify:CR=1 FL=1